MYCKLYLIVIQSEYLRYSNNETKYKKLSFDETPFIDLLGLYIEDNPIQDIQNQVLSFNSKSLCEYIISMSHYATPELLKAAVSYRFIYSCVNAPAPNLPEGRKLYVDEDEEVFNEAQQKLLLKIMVMIIVKDYNFLRQKLDLDYSNEELSTGLISLY